MMVSLVVPLLELLSKFLLRILLVLLLVIVTVVDMGLAPVHLGLHSDPLVQLSQCSQGYWAPSLQMCLGSDHLCLSLT
jgi:disulfide bond formation protein DsbB